MPLVYGNKAKGRLAVMPAKFADTGYSQPGEIYEFHLDTTSFVGQEEAVIDQLMTLESRVPDLKIVYAEACDCGMKVKFQIMDKGPGSIGFGGILALLPAIFVLIGVGIIAYMLWKLYNDVPVLLVVGGVAAAFLALYWFTGEKFFGGIKDISLRGPKKEKERATPTQRLQTEESAINRKIKVKEDIIEKLKKDEVKANVELTTLQGATKPDMIAIGRAVASTKRISNEIDTRQTERENLYERLDELADKY